MALRHVSTNQNVAVTGCRVYGKGQLVGYSIRLAAEHNRTVLISCHSAAAYEEYEIYKLL